MFHFDGSIEKLGMIPAEVEDFSFFGGGAKKAGALGWKRKIRLADGTDAVFPIPFPFDERVPVGILAIFSDPRTSLLPGVVAQNLSNFPTSIPTFPGRWPMVCIFVLRLPLPFVAATLESIS